MWFMSSCISKHKDSIISILHSFPFSPVGLQVWSSVTNILMLEWIYKPTGSFARWYKLVDDRISAWTWAQGWKEQKYRYSYKKVIQGINCFWEIKIHTVSFARQYKFGWPRHWCMDLKHKSEKNRSIGTVN